MFAVTTCLPMRDGVEHQRARGVDAADQLADDVEVRMPRDDVRVVGEVHALDAAHALARAVERARGDPRDADRPPGAAGDLLLVAAQDVPGAATHRAEAEQPDLQRLSWHASGPHSSPSSRNICLMPRIAWRVRDSFSIIAKRT